MIVSVDAMGGDFAPTEAVKGAVLATKELDNLSVVLVGDEALIKKELDALSVKDFSKIEILHADEVILMDDHPSQVLRAKRHSSMHLGLKLVKSKEADGFFTAGNSGSAMVIAMFILGLLEGVSRPAIGTVMPADNELGRFFMLDVGGNVDCRPEHLLTFAIMGSAYAKHILNIASPKVGLLNIGEEEGKGDMLTRATYDILHNCDSLNFIGNIEGKALYRGEADVVVCDGFVGNIAIKISQSIAKYISKLLKEELTSSAISKVGALLAKPAFAKLKQKTDGSQYGGAPLLGVKGTCVIGHGSSNAEAVKNGIKVACQAAENNMNDSIVEDIKNAIASGYF